MVAVWCKGEKKLSCQNEIYKVKKELKELIEKCSYAGYTMPESYSKRAYQKTLSMIEGIEREYRKEIESRTEHAVIKEPGIVELRYDIFCYEREFVIEVNELYKDIAYKIIDVAYSKWCVADQEVADMCCEEYINFCLQSYGIEYTEKNA